MEIYQTNCLIFRKKFLLKTLAPFIPLTILCQRFIQKWKTFFTLNTHTQISSFNISFYHRRALSHTNSYIAYTHIPLQSLSLSLSLTHTDTHTLTHWHTHTDTHTLTHTHWHTHTDTHTLTHTHTPLFSWHFLFFMDISHIHIHSHIHPYNISHSFSLSLTHTLFHLIFTHTSHRHTRSRMRPHIPHTISLPSLSLSHTHSHTHSLPLILSETRINDLLFHFFSLAFSLLWLVCGIKMWLIEWD